MTVFKVKGGISLGSDGVLFSDGTFRTAAVNEVQTLTSNTTITSIDYNKIFIVQNSGEMTITLPDITSLVSGFSFEIHLLGGDEEDVYIEVSNTQNNIIRGGGQYKNFTLNAFSSNLISDIQSLSFNTFLTPTRIRVREYIVENTYNTYKYRLIKISNTSFLVTE